jgi:hypothetical protein
MAKTASLTLVLVLACHLSAQTTARPPTDSELAQIAARGQALAGYDAAAWHASDAVMALEPDKNSIQSYVARKLDSGWVVAWGRFNEAGNKFLIAYEARQKGDSEEYTVTRHDPPIADDDFYFRAARAHRLAFEEFLVLKPSRPYNISILPAPDGNWYVYAIPAQTDLAVLPYGGDVRYTVSADGTKLLEKRQMHQTVLEENIGKNPELGFHTHILSDIPEDSDVFYALTRKAARGEWIVTKQYFYELRLPGTLKYLGPTSEVVKQLQEGKTLALDEPYKSMVLSSAGRLLQDTTSGSPLEAFTTFNGARCTDKTLWLKFRMTLHNVGEKKLILYREPLRNSQARFGATSGEILSDRYEKLAFFSVSPSGEKLSEDSSYITLGPGMTYSREQEYPMLGIDLNGKAAVQFLFFTWPVGQEGELATQQKRLENAGDLFGDTVAATPIPLNIDPALLKACPPSK